MGEADRRHDFVLDMRRWGHKGESREHGHMLTAPAVDEAWGTDTGPLVRGIGAQRIN